MNTPVGLTLYFSEPQFDTVLSKVAEKITDGMQIIEFAFSGGLPKGDYGQTVRLRYLERERENTAEAGRLVSKVRSLMLNKLTEDAKVDLSKPVQLRVNYVGATFSAEGSVERFRFDYDVLTEVTLLNVLMGATNSF